MKHRLIIAATLLTLVFIYSVRTVTADENEPHMEIKLWDLPVNLEFKPVSPGAALKNNPAFLDTPLRTMVVKGLIQGNYAAESPIGPEHIKSLYLAVMRTRAGSSAEITYMAFSLANERLVRDLLTVFRPLEVPEKKGRFSIWFDGNHIITLKLADGPVTVPEEFLELDYLLSDRFRNMVKIQY